MQNYQKNVRILNMDFVFMFDKFKLDEQKQRCIWTSFKFKFGVNSQIPLQRTSFKWNCPHIATIITLQH